ncbi:MAG: hypothetical protein IJS16_03005, partial [Butyrivibrio sp.]|nr:hypothetical protein [Butyrivibrio sp.]
MKSKRSVINLIYIVVFVFMIAAVLIGIPMSTDRLITIHEKIDGYSENWKLFDGTKVYVDDLNIADYGGRVAVEKKLSNGITDKDALCFKSKNTNIRVFIGGRQVYRFFSKSNLTGMGYGVAYHEVGLGTDDAGKMIRLEFEQIYEGQERGNVYDIYLCSATDFIQIVIRQNLLACILSILNIFLGLTLLVAHIGSSNKSIYPFDVLSMGCSSLLMGIWLLISTNIFQLITGHIYVCRDINRIIPFMIAYPAICFLNSLTEKKMSINKHLAFWITFVSVFGIITLRYVLKIDMMDSFKWFAGAYIIATLGVVVLIVTDNALYCMRTGKKNRLRNIYFIGVLFVVCGIIDIIQFFMADRVTESFGLFTRIGATVYVLVILMEFLRWWMNDSAAVERDRFINRALQYALSSNSPDANIRSILSYLGKELDAKRLFIFEDQKNGKYKGTYEWYREGEESFSLEMMYLSSEDIIDRIYDEFNKNDHRLIVRNPDAFKNSIPGFYSLLKTNKVDSMIIGPLEVGGNMFGVCGVVGAPQKNLEFVSEIINLISYFLAQLVLQREEQSRALNYTYKDTLSGCGNYSAFKKYLEDGLDLSSAFGCVRCDLTRLNEVNIREGYEVGDQIVVLAARILMDFFGDSYVFRVNGTQFIAFGFETEE